MPGGTPIEPPEHTSLSKKQTATEGKLHHNYYHNYTLMVEPENN